MRPALARLAVAPFEAAIAALLVISGLAALAGYGLTDPVQALLPGWEATVLAVMSVASGLGMGAGIAAGRRGTEAAGLLFLLAVITSRFLLTGHVLGYGPRFVVTGVFDAAVAWAALARLGTLARGQVIVRVSGERM